MDAGLRVLGLRAPGRDDVEVEHLLLDHQARPGPWMHSRDHIARHRDRRHLLDLKVRLTREVRQARFNGRVDLHEPAAATRLLDVKVVHGDQPVTHQARDHQRLEQRDDAVVGVRDQRMQPDGVADRQEVEAVAVGEVDHLREVVLAVLLVGHAAVHAVDQVRTAVLVLKQQRVERDRRDVAIGRVRGERDAAITPAVAAAVERGAAEPLAAGDPVHRQPVALPPGVDRRELGRQQQVDLERDLRADALLDLLLNRFGRPLGVLLERLAVRVLVVPLGLAVRVSAVATGEAPVAAAILGRPVPQGPEVVGQSPPLLRLEHVVLIDRLCPVGGGRDHQTGRFGVEQDRVAGRAVTERLPHHAGSDPLDPGGDGRRLARTGDRVPLRLRRLRCQLRDHLQRSGHDLRRVVLQLVAVSAVAVADAGLADGLRQIGADPATQEVSGGPLAGPGALHAVERGRGQLADPLGPLPLRDGREDRPLLILLVRHHAAPGASIRRAGRSRAPGRRRSPRARSRRWPAPQPGKRQAGYPPPPDRPAARPAGCSAGVQSQASSMSTVTRLTDPSQKVANSASPSARNCVTAGQLTWPLWLLSRSRSVPLVFSESSTVFLACFCANATSSGSNSSSSAIACQGSPDTRVCSSLSRT